MECKRVERGEKWGIMLRALRRCGEGEGGGDFEIQDREEVKGDIW